MTQMTPLERLSAIEGIKALMSRRCRALDAKDWDTYRAHHAPDHVSYDTVAPGGARGPALIEALKARLEGVSTVHHAHSPEIFLESRHEARGVWSLEDWWFWSEGDTRCWRRGWGNYHDTYALRDGSWLFTSRRIERIHFEWSPGSARFR